MFLSSSNSRRAKPTNVISAKFFIQLSLIVLAVLSFAAVFSIAASCPFCMNGSQCNPSTGTCDCLDGWTGSDCSEIVCFNSSLSSNDTCQCSANWGGYDCRSCKNDLACQLQSGNSSYVCDTSLITYATKHFTCGVDNSTGLATLIGTEMTFMCNGSTQETAGECYMQVWDTDTGSPVENFWCTFSNCTISVGPAVPPDQGVSILYHCTKSACNCTFESPKCSMNPWSFSPYLLYSLVTGMVTTADVTCNNITQACILTQNELRSMQIPVVCNASECVSHYVPPPPPPPTPPAAINWFLVYSAAGMGALLLVIVISIIACSGISAFQTKRMRKVHEAESLLQCSARGASLTFRNLTYLMPVRENGVTVQKKLLDNVSHSIGAGQVLAIMGPSGAGKTTLLDILAQRSKKGKLTGQVLINDRPIDASFKRISGYVFQDDILMSTLTVRECLMFAANLRLPDAISKAEKAKRVESVLEELGISHIAERRIGNELKRGISGGEKRRVSIGMELVSSPKILFLDEPTSGLDSWNAFCVIQSLVQLAKNGRTIVFSIHQPRYNIFQQFDQLILMSRGKIAYAGRADDAIVHFTKLGYTIPPNVNPADILIDILTEQSKKNDLTPPSDPVTEHSPLLRDNVGPSRINYPSYSSDIEDVVSPTNDQVVFEYATSQDNRDKSARYTDRYTLGANDLGTPAYATSFASQFTTLSGRAFKNFLRNFYLMPAHYGSAILMGLLLGLIYWKEGLTLEGIQNRLGAIFFILALQAFGAMSSLELFIAERALYVRERANGYYYPSAYFLSKACFDIIPLRVLPPIIISSISYWMIGLRPEPLHFAYFVGIMVLFNFTSSSMCLTIGTIVPSVATGNVVSIMLILFSMLFGGFLLNLKSVKKYLMWMQYSSYFYYAFEALVINEMWDVNILIDPEGLPPVAGKGSFILNNLGMDHSRFAMDVGILCAFSAFYIILAAVLLKFFVKERR